MKSAGGTPFISSSVSSVTGIGWQKIQSLDRKENTWTGTCVLSSVSVLREFHDCGRVVLLAVPQEWGGKGAQVAFPVASRAEYSVKESDNCHIHPRPMCLHSN
jgi:hypothetical protein